MTPAQTRIMTLGRELDMLNRVRAMRMAMLRRPQWEAFSPAGQAAFINGTAIIDQRRREVKAALAGVTTGAVCEMHGEQMRPAGHTMVCPACAAAPYGMMPAGRHHHRPGRHHRW